MFGIRRWINNQIKVYEANAWDEGFDYAWNLAEKCAGPIQYVHFPGEGYEANPHAS